MQFSPYVKFHLKKVGVDRIKTIHPPSGSDGIASIGATAQTDYSFNIISLREEVEEESKVTNRKTGLNVSHNVISPI